MLSQMPNLQQKFFICTVDTTAEEGAGAAIGGEPSQEGKDAWQLEQCR